MEEKVAFLMGVVVAPVEEVAGLVLRLQSELYSPEMCGEGTGERS